MNLSELKQKPIDELLEMTASMGLDNLARSANKTSFSLSLKDTPKAVKIFTATEYLKYYLMDLGFYALQGLRT